MKLFLTMIQVKNGFRVQPVSPGDQSPEHEEFVFESLESMNKWLPTYTTQQFKGAKEKAGK